MKSVKTNAFTQISRVQDKCREEILFFMTSFAHTPSGQWFTPNHGVLFILRRNPT